MSYTKTTWSDGDVITAEKLNNIESGVESASTSGSILIIHENDGTLDKTWQEICDSFIDTIPVYYYSPYDNGNDFGYALLLVSAVRFSSIDNKYYVLIQKGSSQIEYATTSSSDYPKVSML